jgi:hypothetical protein
MDLLASKYKLKDGSVGEPTNYLGAKIEKFKIEGAADPTKHCWAMSSDDYLSRAVKEVERTLAEVDQFFLICNFLYIPNAIPPMLCNGGELN